MCPIDHASLYIGLDHSYELYAFLVAVALVSKVEPFNHLVVKQEHSSWVYTAALLDTCVSCQRLIIALLPSDSFLLSTKSLSH